MSKNEENENKGGLTSHSYTSTSAPFDPEKHFKNYHHYEPFDEIKMYVNQQKADYGHGERTYKYSKYTVNVFDKAKNRVPQTYVVAVERLEKEDLKALVPYCQCALHIWPWYLIGMLVMMRMCPYCIGCLGARNDPPQWNIDAARKHALTDKPRKEEMEAWKQYVGFVIGLVVLFLLFAVGMTVVPLILVGLGYLVYLVVEGVKMAIGVS